jgi:hypothetical protein
MRYQGFIMFKDRRNCFADFVQSHQRSVIGGQLKAENRQPSLLLLRGLR